MESILARALEYTLKYWLKSFSRDQFKLQGLTAQLSNLDINGDALHASMGLPPALNVTKAKVGKLEITLPSVSNVQVEPIIVQIDQLDLVLEENPDLNAVRSSSGPQASTSSKGGGYGFADKIADGMTIEVGTVNLLLETGGGARQQGGVTWISPIASITIRNLLLYTTNENWQVVNLKEARDFSNNKKYIYVFKTLEWDSLSIDLLPHPDMFADERLMSSENEGNRRDDDGAKRLFFGGERFLEGISGYAHITVQRTEYNSPLGLEVQLHVTEAVCPALSEPGLRALLRFMTGLYVCLNRGDMDPKAQQHCTEAAGRSLVSIIVDHIFICIKDAEFQLELLMQSLFFSRASISDGENSKNLSRIMVGGLFLRDAFTHPPCTLVQPSMQTNVKEYPHAPEFGDNFCPPIYPLGDERCHFNAGVPLICFHSLQINPSPVPPSFASQTVIDCQPLMINLQEESCLKISSFLADGIVVNPGAVLPDFSVNSIAFTIKEFDLTVPLDARKTSDLVCDRTYPSSTFFGARLHVEDLFFSQSPSVKCKLLNLDKDPVCFSLWKGQPIDASHKKLITQVSHLAISLETCSGLAEQKIFPDLPPNFWTCVELQKACFEAAMLTADGSPLVHVPPPGGVVRIGVACQQYLSNTSIEQLFYVLDLYSYFGRVSDQIMKIARSNKQSRDESSREKLLEKVPSDTAVSLAVTDLQLNFLESSSVNIQGMPLVKFSGEDLFVKVSHRTLGGAFAVSTNLHWKSVGVDCVDAEGIFVHQHAVQSPVRHDMISGNRCPQMRSVFWTIGQYKDSLKPAPFLDISAVHVMPYDVRDVECHSLNVSAKIAGVRLGGGMSYTEALLHRFGILGPNGGPSERLSRGLEHLSSGPLAKLFRASSLVEASQGEDEYLEDELRIGVLELGRPDDVDIFLEMENWLFALEGAQEVGEEWFSYNCEDIRREDRCWHTTFQSLRVTAKSNPRDMDNPGKLCGRNKYPVEFVTVCVEGLQALKPSTTNLQTEFSTGEIKSIIKSNGRLTGTNETRGGVNLEVNMVMSSDEESVEIAKWMVENLKVSVKEPVEAVVTRDELEHLTFLCRSEFDSMGRIAAGVLRLLKLDESVGQATIDQLSNLGRESLDKIFTPDKLSRCSSIGSISFTPSPNAATRVTKQSVESTMTSLEAILSDSQAKCSALVVELSSPEFSGRHLADIKQVNQNLERMQVLLMSLRTQI
uniref:UHRF1-binding protein 1-like n=1 Tax=Anthurium amnicola TaxID=1678845 RepID=A0A1D1ZAH3_9ARAE